MTATATRDPYKLQAGALALVVHGMFFALLYLGLSWNRTVSMPATMSVELWQSLPEPAVVPPPPSPPVEEAAPLPPEPVAKPDIAMPEKKKVASKPEKKPPKPVKAIKPEPKEPVEKPVEPAPVEQKQEDIAAQQRAAQALAEKLKQEQQQAEKGRVIDEFKGKILAKIRRNIVQPPDVANNARAEFQVTLLPGGGVLKAELKKSSGNAAYDTAVERAILKSDPLPLPPDPQMFKEFRVLNLGVKPTE